jgi:phage host-nuclease inhibitor protein Gam
MPSIEVKDTEVAAVEEFLRQFRLTPAQRIAERMTAEKAQAEAILARPDIAAEVATLVDGRAEVREVEAVEG